MADALRKRQLRERAAALPPEERPASDPLRALEPLRRGLGPLLFWLLAWAAAAPALTGSASAALLAGVPALALTALACAARAPARRRAALLLATALCGFLALAAAPALTSLGQLAGPRPGPAVYQLACLLGPGAFLLRASSAWRLFNRDQASQDALSRLQDEL
jgi:hypothetical protein